MPQLLSPGGCGLQVTCSNGVFTLRPPPQRSVPLGRGVCLHPHLAGPRRNGRPRVRCLLRFELGPNFT